MMQKKSMMDANQFFRKASLCLNSSLVMDTALERLRYYLGSNFPVDALFLMLFNYEKNHFEILAKSIDESMDIELPESVVVKDGLEHVECFFEKSDPLSIIGKPEENEISFAWAKAMGNFDMSIMAVMLAIEDERLGCLVAVTMENNRYSKEHGNLFKLLKESAAMAMSNALRYRELQTIQEELKDENKLLIKELGEVKKCKVIGETTGLIHVMDMVNRVAPNQSPVLILGETGVGKEVIANAIYQRSKRNNRPFIKVNCGGIPESLMDSELFGHEKGAFTGADNRKPGRFERANGGTIFLDEVGELSRDAQVRLLRVLQNKEIERVGGNSVIKVNIRVISATNRDMEKMVRQGDFREDLWFRLNVLPIMIPPLRLRKQDIPALVNHIIELKRREMNLVRIPVLTNSQFGELAAYHWPGNVRELENIIERWLIVGDTVGSFRQLINHEPFLTEECRVEPDSEDPDIPKTIMPMKDLIIKHIQMAVKASNGQIGGRGGAAEKLDMHPNTLRSRMLKLGMIHKNHAL